MNSRTNSKANSRVSPAATGSESGSVVIVEGSLELYEDEHFSWSEVDADSAESWFEKGNEGGSIGSSRGGVSIGGRGKGGGGAMGGGGGSVSGGSVDGKTSEDGGGKAYLNDGEESLNFALKNATPPATKRKKARGNKRVRISDHIEGIGYMKRPEMMIEEEVEVVEVALDGERSRSSSESSAVIDNYFEVPSWRRNDEYGSVKSEEGEAKRKGKMAILEEGEEDEEGGDQELTAMMEASAAAAGKDQNLNRMMDDRFPHPEFFALDRNRSGNAKNLARNEGYLWLLLMLLLLNLREKPDRERE